MILHAHQANAQSIDYNAFETLFREPVTTSATGKPERESELSPDTQIITSEQIVHSGATSIFEVLRMVPGVDVRRYGQYSANVSIRGNDGAGGSRTLVLVDGRQVYQDGYNFTDWGTIPVALNDIHQIEVIRGPNSALYGFNASGGVINIVTRDPLHETRNFVKFDTGSLDRIGGELALSHKFSEKFASKLTVVGSRSRAFSSADLPNVTPNSMSINAALELRGQITQNIDWLLSGSISHSIESLWLDFGTYDRSHPTSKTLMSNINADTKWGIFQLKVYHNQYDSANFVDAHAFNMDIPINLYYNIGTTVSQLSDLITLNSKNNLRLGVEYRVNQLNATSLGQRLSSPSEVLGAASATWSSKLTSHLSATVAGRADVLAVPSTHGFIGSMITTSQSKRFVEPSFNTHLRYDAGNLGIFGLSVARSVQLPALLNFVPTIEFGPLMMTNNPSLTPSTTLNIGLDYSRPIEALDANLRLATFAQRTNNMLGTPFASNFTYLPPVNVAVMPRNYGLVDAAGGELQLTGKTHFGLRWDVSYALSSVRDLDKASKINFQRQAPVNSVIGGLDYTYGPLQVSSHARWQSHYQDVNANFQYITLDNALVHNFVTVNARIAWAFNKYFTVAVDGNQLNASSLVQTGGSRIQRQIYGSIFAHF